MPTNACSLCGNAYDTVRSTSPVRGTARHTRMNDQQYTVSAAMVLDNTGMELLQPESDRRILYYMTE